jgi:hypothetical protein
VFISYRLAALSCQSIHTLLRLFHEFLQHVEDEIVYIDLRLFVLLHLELLHFLSDLSDTILNRIHHLGEVVPIRTEEGLVTLTIQGILVLREFGTQPFHIFPDAILQHQIPLCVKAVVDVLKGDVSDHHVVVHVSLDEHRATVLLLAHHPLTRQLDRLLLGVGDGVARLRVLEAHRVDVRLDVVTRLQVVLATPEVVHPVDHQHLLTSDDVLTVEVLTLDDLDPTHTLHLVDEGVGLPRSRLPIIQTTRKLDGQQVLRLEGEIVFVFHIHARDSPGTRIVVGNVLTLDELSTHVPEVLTLIHSVLGLPEETRLTRFAEAVTFLLVLGERPLGTVHPAHLTTSVHLVAELVATFGRRHLPLSDHPTHLVVLGEEPVEVVHVTVFELGVSHVLDPLTIDTAELVDHHQQRVQRDLLSLEHPIPGEHVVTAVDQVVLQQAVEFDEGLDELRNLGVAFVGTRAHSQMILRVHLHPLRVGAIERTLFAVVTTQPVGVRLREAIHDLLLVRVNVVLRHAVDVLSHDRTPVGSTRLQVLGELL